MSTHIHNWLVFINIRVEKIDVVRCSFLDKFRRLSDWLRFRRWSELLHLNWSNCGDNYIRDFRALNSREHRFERCFEAILIRWWWRLMLQWFCKVLSEIFRHIERSRWSCCDIWISRENVTRYECEKSECEWWCRSELLSTDSRLFSSEQYLID